VLRKIGGGPAKRIYRASELDYWDNQRRSTVLTRYYVCRCRRAVEVATSVSCRMTEVNTVAAWLYGSRPGLTLFKSSLWASRAPATFPIRV